MYTIVLATQKGGSGKSTLAIGLALAAIEAGHATRLIEADPLGTLSNWQRRRPDPAPLVEPLGAVADLAPRLAALDHAGISVCIVDTASGVSAATTTAIRHCDLVLIPARPSVADVEATASVLALARAWEKPFAYVLNQTPIRGRRIAAAASNLADQAELEAAGVLAQPLMVMRNDHQDALAAGLSVTEFAPHAKSADEIRGLWRWVETRLGIARPIAQPAAAAVVDGAPAEIAAAPGAPAIVPPQAPLSIFLTAGTEVSLVP